MRQPWIHLFVSFFALTTAAACGDDGDGDDHDIDAADGIDAPATTDAADTPDADENAADADENAADAEEGAPDADPNNTAPVASFEFGPPCTSSSNTMITFTSTSTDVDGDLLTCSWVFSSGTPGTADTCVVTGVTFPNISPYPVTLTVDDGNGGTDSVTLDVPPCDA